MNSFTDYIENAIQWALANKDRRDYQYKCLAFVEDAYEQSNSLEMFGGDTAKESAEMYSPLHSGSPERGAFVFFKSEGPINGITKEWGHVGLSLGNDKVIHIWDTIRIDNYRDIEKLQGAEGWTFPEYIGWAGPDIFLKGFKKW